MLRRKRILRCPEEDLNPHNQSCPLPKNRGHNLSLISNPHICPDGHRVTLTEKVKVDNLLTTNIRRHSPVIWRYIAISLIGPVAGVLSAMAWLQKLASSALSTDRAEGRRQAARIVWARGASRQP